MSFIHKISSIFSIDSFVSNNKQIFALLLTRLINVSISTFVLNIGNIIMSAPLDITCSISILEV